MKFVNPLVTLSQEDGHGDAHPRGSSEINCVKFRAADRNWRRRRNGRRGTSPSSRRNSEARLTTKARETLKLNPAAEAVYDDGDVASRRVARITASSGSVSRTHPGCTDAPQSRFFSYANLPLLSTGRRWISLTRISPIDDPTRRPGREGRRRHRGISKLFVVCDFCEVILRRTENRPRYHLVVLPRVNYCPALLIALSRVRFDLVFLTQFSAQCLTFFQRAKDQRCSLRVIRIRLSFKDVSSVGS